METEQPKKHACYGRERIALFLVFTVACAVRFAGIDFGLPHTLCRPDESTVVDKAWFVFQGDPNPHFFNYPSLFIYLLAALFSLRFGILALCGVPAATLNAELTANPAPLFMAARLLSAGLGTMTVLIVYPIAKRAFDRRTGLLAAIFMSVCYLHARDSHFGTTDVPMTFFTACAVLFMIKAHAAPHPTPTLSTAGKRGDTLRNYIIAGMFTGLATSTKYGGMFLVVPMLAGHFMRQPGQWRNICAYAAAAAVAFLATTPFAVLDFGTFFSHFMAEAHHLAVGETAWGRPLRFSRGWWYHLRYTLPYGAGILMCLAAAAGLCMAARRKVTSAVVLFGFPIAFYLVAGRGYTVFVRYMVPVTPFICVAAALFCARAAGRLPTIAAQRCALGLLAFILAAEPLSNIMLFNGIISRRDNRLVVHDWMLDNLPAGSTVYQTGKPFNHALLPSGFRTFKLRDRSGAMPDYILVHRHPLPATRVHNHIEKLLASEYRLLVTFQAMNPSVEDNWFDRMDAFYLPLRGFRGIRRPGPNTEIHAKRENDGA